MNLSPAPRCRRTVTHPARAADLKVAQQAIGGTHHATARGPSQRHGVFLCGKVGHRVGYDDGLDVVHEGVSGRQQDTEMCVYTTDDQLVAARGSQHPAQMTAEKGVVAHVGQQVFARGRGVSAATMAAASDSSPIPGPQTSTSNPR